MAGRQAVVFLLVCVLAGGVRVVGATLPVHVFGRMAHPNSQFEFCDTPDLELQKLNPQEIVTVAPLAIAPGIVLKGFDPAYGIQKISFFYLDPGTGAEAAVQVDSDSGTSWWRLTPRAGVEENILSRLRFRRYRPQLWFEPIGNATIPLIHFGFAWYEGYGNMGTLFWEHYLFDFRPCAPAVLAHLQCSQPEGGGNCTSADNDYEVGYGIECRWIAEREDLLCDVSELIPRDWASYVFHLPYYQLTDDEPPVPDELKSEPASLAEMAIQFERNGTTETRPAELKFASMTHLAALGGLHPGWRIHLFATPVIFGELGARFYAVVLRDGLPPQTKKIVSSGGANLPLWDTGTWPLELQAETDRLEDEATRVDAANASWIDETPPSYATRVYSGGAGRAFVQVVATESFQEASHALYLIGIDVSSGVLVADKFLAATSGRPYLRCMLYKHPATAISIHPAWNPLKINLQMQGEWVVNGVAPEPQQVVTAEGRLTWTSQGFRLQEKPETERMKRSVRVDITDDGAVEALPVSQPIKLNK